MVPSSAALISSAVFSGCSAAMRAAAPATCGAAMDVPWSSLYPLPGDVLYTFDPGAAIWTKFGLKFVKEERSLSPEIEATVIIFLNENVAG